MRNDDRTFGEHGVPESDAGGERSTSSPQRRPTAHSRLLDAGEPGAVARTVAAIAAGRLVAFPTDTVYALAGSLDHPAALDRIFAVKGRPGSKPLPLLIAAPEALSRVAIDPPPAVLALVARYWPGPLTVVVDARPHLPAAVVGPGRTVAVRQPNHPLALDVVARAGGAIAATSANRSGRPPALDPSGVRAQLGDDIDLLLCNGQTPGSLASTVIGFANGELTIHRDGPIPGDLLRAAWRDLSAR